jgi:hypothetical protein
MTPDPRFGTGPLRRFRESRLHGCADAIAFRRGRDRRRRARDAGARWAPSDDPVASSRSSRSNSGALGRGGALSRVWSAAAPFPLGPPEVWTAPGLTGCQGSTAVRATPRPSRPLAGATHLHRAGPLDSGPGRPTDWENRAADATTRVTRAPAQPRRCPVRRRVGWDGQGPRYESQPPTRLASEATPEDQVQASVLLESL